MPRSWGSIAPFTKQEQSSSRQGHQKVVVRSRRTHLISHEHVEARVVHGGSFESVNLFDN